MKNSKLLLVLLIITSILSCESDEEISLSDQLIGEWVRSDFSDDLEFKLIFNENNVGFRTLKEGNGDVGIVSSAIQFNWSIEQDILTFIELDNEITTSVVFHLDGALVLKEYSDLHFIKME